MATVLPAICRLPTPDDLCDAPELSVVVALDATLAAAETALFAANRELEANEGPFDDGAPQPPRVWLADSILALIPTLRTALERYRRATVRERERRDAQYDDLPF